MQTDNHGRDADPAAGTLLLTRSDVLATLDPKTCIEAVEQAFRMHGERRTLGPAMLGVHVPGGGFHVKAAGLLLDRKYFAAKTNANFPDNGRRFGLPTIQGTVVLCDADDGRPLALMDSMALTALRTAAATAVAAKHLARREARSVALGGCGVQAAAQLDALAALIPISIVYVVDLDAARATRFAAETAARLDLAVEVRGDLHAAALAADIVVTCTSSREAILAEGDVAPGAFIAAVGADNPEKQEIAPALMAAANVVVDELDQCAEIGDLHHAIAAGAMTKERIHASLGEIVAGKKPGRRRDDEIFVFDSTGIAIQDVAAAAVVYRNALAAGRGRRIDFAS
ncbi:MAG TPA: ornithine cyclodeaminase family protein [Alphaproteobacteria bacterium]|nr:ornithine cyclodeaminase family protein [Alphaproteobacteria bacterium]